MTFENRTNLTITHIKNLNVLEIYFFYYSLSTGMASYLSLNAK